MAGTVVTTEETISTVKKVSFAWTSDSNLADATTTKVFTGEIIRFNTIPGSPAPDVDYDVVVNDEDGTDVLMGAGANRHTSATEQVLGTSLGCVANDKLTLAITNAGDAKKGVVNLYIR